MPPTPRADLDLVRQLAESARAEIGALTREVDALRADVARLQIETAKASAVREWLGRVPAWVAIAVSGAVALRTFGVI